MAALLLAALAGLAPDAAAQTVPRRQIPHSVLSELALLETRFDAALAADCHPDRCWSKGCAYGDHAVIDRPRAASLPGLSDGTGPGAVEPQEFLTAATCAFTYEPTTVSAADAEALGRRLQQKVSHGFTVVSVSRQELLPLSEDLQVAPAPPAPPPAPELPPPPAPRWSASVAARELWTHLLPHFAWMIALVLGTAAATALFWAWRRVGRETVEEKALLAQLLREEASPPDGPAEEEAADDGGEAFVAAESAAWRDRLARVAAGTPDPALRALVRELLHDRDWATLGKAVLTFPDFLATFPEGGDVAAAKLELAGFLKTVDEAALPDDEVFYRTLSRVARSAQLADQGDARLIRSLRDEFGAAGLVALSNRIPGRPAAVLFALAPVDEQREMTRLLPARTAEELAEQLLRSNRMDEAETAYLFALLEAARAGGELPTPPPGELSERGAPFEAAGPLSVLLGALAPASRAELLGDAVTRFHGTLPAWLRQVVYPDLLLALPTEDRADLFLEVDAAPLSAWLSLQDEAARGALLDGMPRALRASLDGVVPEGRAQVLSAAESARAALARGLQQRLVRAGRTFEDVIAQGPAAAELP